MKEKQPQPHPSRFAAGAEDFEPMRLVETIDGLKEEEEEEERGENAAYAEPLRKART